MAKEWHLRVTRSEVIHTCKYLRRILRIKEADFHSLLLNDCYL